MNDSYWNKVTGERVGRRRILKAGAAFSVGAAGLALLGCGSDDGDDSDAGAEPTTAAGEIRRGGRIGTTMNSVSNYNVVVNFHEGYNNSGVTAYDRLLTSRTDKRGYVLEAAEKVEVASPTKIIFTLKPNMVFQNIAPVSGRAVTSSDIVASQNYVKTLSNAYDSAFQRNFISSVESPDPRTVVFNLTRPSAYIFGIVQFGAGTSQAIIPKEMLDKLDSTPPIGSGPYQLADHTFNVKYLWKRFEQYRDAKAGRPYLDEREIFQIQDAVALEASFRSGQTHVFSPAATAVDRLKKELSPTDFTFTEVLTTSQYKWEANNNPKFNKVWRDVRVREALYRLTVRQQFLDLIYQGKGAIPPGPLPLSLETYLLKPAEVEKFFKEDVAEAKRLLDAAVFPYDKEFETITTTSGSNAAAIEVWQQQLAKAGIKTRPVALPFADWSQRMQDGNYEIQANSGTGTDTPIRFLRKFHSDQQEQVSNMGLFDKNIDAMIEKSEGELNKEENIKLVKQIQLEVLKLYGSFYNVLTPNTTIFQSAKLEGWERDASAPGMYQTGAWLKA